MAKTVYARQRVSVATMGAVVLSVRAMARLWACAALLALCAVCSRAESDRTLLELGRKALCTASHSRFLHSVPRTSPNANPSGPACADSAHFNVFLVFGVRPCSGILISAKHVLTSFYCTEHHFLDGIAFMGGKKYQTLQDLELPEVKLAVVNGVKRFNETDDYLDHDVAFCTLKTRIELSDNITYASLTELDRWETPAEGLMMGFGETFEGDSAHELRCASTRLECGPMCSSELTTMKLGENALCGYNTSYSQCWGDFGGPVISNGAVVGLMTYKLMKTPTYRPCSDPPIRTFYMFLGYYRKWIEKHLPAPAES